MLKGGMSMEKLGAFITKLHPLYIAHLFPIDHLLVEEVRKFVIKDISEIPLLQLKVSPFFNSVQKRDNKLDICNGLLQVRQLSLPALETVSEGFEFGSQELGCIKLGKGAFQEFETTIRNLGWHIQQFSNLKTFPFGMIVLTSTKQGQ